MELLDATMQRLDETEDRVHAFAFLAADARKQARAAEREIASGALRGSLHGIPLGVKDNFLTAGMITEAGSRALAGHVPDIDAEAVARLRRAGAVIVGKTVTHEFAYGQGIPPTRNPWNLNRYSGGSSAGTAVSVAVGSSLGGLGTDTGGSIRIPSALSGATGLKPTFGRVSKRGVIPLSATMDHAGPIARTAEDVAILLDAVAGFDRGDPTSMRRKVVMQPLSDAEGIRGMRLGVERGFYFGPQLTDPARAVAEAALAVLERLGARLVTVQIPELETAAAVGRTIISVEASYHLGRWLRQGAREIGPGIRSALELGELISGTDYLRATQARRALIERMRETFRRHRLHALVTPTLARTAIPIAELPGEPRLPFTIPFNLTGQPALTIPAGFGPDGLPIGVQIAGRPWDEPTVLRIGHAYQTVTNWHLAIPTFATAP